MNKNLNKCLAISAALLLSICTSCADKPTPAEPSKEVGVSRPAELIADTASPGSDPITEPAIDSPENTEPATATENPDSGSTSSGEGNYGNVKWSLTNGKYTYTIPELDRSGLSDLTDVNNTSRALFSDQGDDLTGSWYFAKTEYNETTGEVTFVWGDRAADTLQILRDNHAIYRGDETRNVCYFTFDCGYENGYTNAILDTLKEKSVPGVFFLTGHYVNTAQEEIRRMIDEGHLLGNHTVDHTNMTTVDSATFISEVEGLENMIKEAFPDAPPTIYYRPPYGAANEWSLKMAAKMGLRTVLWSNTYKDYDPDDQLDNATALQKIKTGLHPGCVYLFHTVSSTNAAVLGDAIDWIRAQGYEILPICDIE